MENLPILTLIAAAAIGCACAYLGSLMLSRRMALVAGPLGHLTLPGIALALIYGFNVSLGAFPFVILGVLLIWWCELNTRLPMEALTALVFASGVAITFLFLPIGQAEAALVGEISDLDSVTALITIAACAGVMIVTHRVYPRLVLLNISEDLAIAADINVKHANLTYLLLIAVIVALGVKLVGGLLTAALVAIPPLTARNFSRNLRQYALGATLLGVVSSVAGVVLHRLSAYPAGPLIILVSASLFLVSLPAAKHTS